GTLRCADGVPGQVLHRGDAGLGEDPLGGAQPVDGDDLGLAAGRQPVCAGADVGDVQIALVQRLDLQRAVGEGQCLHVHPVFLPQPLVLGDRVQRGTVVVHVVPQPPGVVRSAAGSCPVIATAACGEQ